MSSVQDWIDPTALILVAVMNDPRDLEIARLLGWYRIPLRSAPKVIAVDYLAFYQTASFESQKWSIQTIAPVQGHELTTRQELLRDEPDHPHAHHEYFKVQLGPLQKLPHPIRAEHWRRITFFYTTGEYLMQARDVKDLVVGEEQRATLWRALRERQLTGQIYQTAGPYELELTPVLLAELLGLRELESEYSVTPGPQDHSQPPERSG